jgi:hypothetical protein
MRREHGMNKWDLAIVMPENKLLVCRLHNKQTAFLPEAPLNMGRIAKSLFIDFL